MKRTEKEVGRFVLKVTGKAFRDRLTEKVCKMRREREQIVNKVIDTHLKNAQLDPPIPIPPQYIPLIRQQREKPKRGRGRPKQAPQSPEQIAQDAITFHAMRRLMRDGWSETAAADAVGDLIGRTRPTTAECYGRGFVSYLKGRGRTPTEVAIAVEVRKKSTRKFN